MMREQSAETGPFMHPARLAPDHPLVTSFSTVIQRVIQEQPAIVYSSATADADLLNHAGIPVSAMGPARSGWHTPTTSPCGRSPRP
jgi:acetylornithine deacetylase/succinyl-diaminopimelate desuccinylase-like protein